MQNAGCRTPRRARSLTQAQVDEIAGYLQSHGIVAAAYHAGRSAFARAEAQAAFLAGAAPVVVATIAFGLGIDKPDVRGVIHFSLPKSLDNYVQVTVPSPARARPHWAAAGLEPARADAARCLARADRGGDSVWAS